MAPGSEPEDVDGRTVHVPQMSIGELAEATGVAPGTLRMWETRHGFPRASRQEGGHRRYGGDEAQRVLRVVRDREQGLSLTAAIERAKAWAPTDPPSLFAAMRTRQPELEPRRLPFSAILKISHAIEDECFARAAHPVVLGSFQNREAYERSATRWRELTRTSSCAVVLGDFPQDWQDEDGPIALALRPNSPVMREWAVVCIDDHYTACLTAWEQPRSADDRLFEAVWTTVPAAAAATVEAALRLADRGADALPERAREALARAAATPEPDCAATLRLANRMVGYLAGAPER